MSQWHWHTLWGSLWTSLLHHQNWLCGPHAEFRLPMVPVFMDIAQLVDAVWSSRDRPFGSGWHNFWCITCAGWQAGCQDGITRRNWVGWHIGQNWSLECTLGWYIVCICAQHLEYLGVGLHLDDIGVTTVLYGIALWCGVIGGAALANIMLHCGIEIGASLVCILGGLVCHLCLLDGPDVHTDVGLCGNMSYHLSSSQTMTCVGV